MGWWVGGLVADGGCTGRFVSFLFFIGRCYGSGVGRLCI